MQISQNLFFFNQISEQEVHPVLRNAEAVYKFCPLALNVPNATTLI